MMKYRKRHTRRKNKNEERNNSGFWNKMNINIILIGICIILLIGCTKKVEVLEPVNETPQTLEPLFLNLTVNHKENLNVNHKEKIVECVREMKIIKDCSMYRGCYIEFCYRCKNHNLSIMPDIIPVGDWICPI